MWGNIQAMRVAEIFYSISGEGQSSGLPSTFIRFAGCNFSEEGHSCSYCDSPQAWHKSQGKIMAEGEILDEISQHKGKHVILTGGEPLFQDIMILTACLRDRGYILELETNGSIIIPTYFRGTVSLDIKCPSSGNSDYNKYENLGKVFKKDQVKFICQDRQDFNFALGILGEYPTSAQIYFQSVWNKLDPKELSEWISYPHRLSLQIHKVLGVK